MTNVWRARRFIVAILMLMGFGCNSTPSDGSLSASASPTQDAFSSAAAFPTAPEAPSMTNAPSATVSALPAPTVVRNAPSLAMSSAIDARDAAALEKCQSLRTGQANASKTCGEADPPSIDLVRFEASALDLDTLTMARVVAVAKRGHSLGRNPRAFGLVGDSITVSQDFLAAFGASQKSAFMVDPSLAKGLELGDGTSVIDFFRGAVVEDRDGVSRDSFTADRAAKVGARAPWAIDGGNDSPVAKLIASVNPAIAIVSYGANDASFRTAPPEDLADEIDKNLSAVIHELEGQGVVVILESEMRHGDQPGVKACPSDDARVNDWRLAVGTNATTARTAEMALRDHIPFADVRYALDSATNHGLGPDAVHPSVNRRGGGLLTREGLDCGYNIRNLVTLRELEKVVRVLEEAKIFPTGRVPTTNSTTDATKTHPTK